MIRTHLYPAVSLTVIFALLACGVFPVVIWLAGSLFFPYQAAGSLIEINGKVVGSELIGQTFTSPRYFHPRPSAAGAGYDPLSSGGTNLGPTSSKLIKGIEDKAETSDIDESYAGAGTLAAAYRTENGLGPSTLLPSDAATRSASGLDPHISPENAFLQVPRVARERGIAPEKVRSLVSSMVEARFLQLIGEPRVNVLQLNLALDQLAIQ